MSTTDSVASATTGATGSDVAQATAPNELEVTGLPEPDGTMHKASSFRTLLAPFRAGRLLDINAEKRSFAITSAHLGWKVTALNTRRPADESLDDSPEVAALLESISWWNGDLAEYPIARDDFDMIVIHDLNHHHTLEQQRALARRCAGTPLILDARIASGRVVDAGSYQGRYLADDSEESVDTTALPPEAPFMHTEESLVRLLRDCGFPLVMMSRPPHKQDMAFYLALPRNWDAPTKGRRSEKRLARRDGVVRSGSRSNI